MTSPTLTRDDLHDLRAIVLERIELSDARITDRIGEITRRLDVLNGRIPSLEEASIRADERLRALEANDSHPRPGNRPSTPIQSTLSKTAPVAWISALLGYLLLGIQFWFERQP